MRVVKVLFGNGDSITTSINGSEQEIRSYYGIGRQFNIGAVDDNMQSVKSLEFIA